MDICEHLTAIKYHRCTWRTETEYEPDEVEKRCIDRYHRLYVKCIDNRQKQRHRDLNVAINILRLLATKPAGEMRQAYLEPQMRDRKPK